MIDAAPETVSPAPLSTDEIDQLRAETAACRDGVVHFNHAGDSPSPDPVLEAVIRHLRLESAIGGYEAAAVVSERLAGMYTSIANLLGASSKEIAFIENATRAWDMVFYSIPFQPGDRILTTRAEYGSNVIAFLQVARLGVSVEVIPDDESGAVDPAALREMLDERVRLVAVTHMPTNGGLIQPAAAIGAVLRDSGSEAVYLLDACQTVGQLPIDVGAIGCHALSATSRKYLRGPRGAGFLYIQSDLANRLEPPLLDNHAATWTAAEEFEIVPDARRFENWERSVAGMLGLGAAADYAQAIGLNRIGATVVARARNLRHRLNSIPGVTVQDIGEQQGAITTFTVDGVTGSEIKSRLAEARINVSLSGITSTRFDMERRGLTELVRASVHYTTTEAECDRLAEVVASLTAPAS